ncbi:MAG TPA: hypothetical protein VM074_04905 [Solimonas sp.]|nr:hypothetical protein [Solimonas sp.]
MDRKQLEQIRDDSAQGAIGARDQIEVAVERGELPVWVLDACNTLEFSAQSYGAARAKLKDANTLMAPASFRLH